MGKDDDRSAMFGSRVCLWADPADPAPTSVASIRPNKSGSPNNNFGIQGDTFTSTNGTLRELIRVAYAAREMELSKGQEWIESERFDIMAKARAQLKPARVPDELKQLLAERFGLKVHNETREVPIYALMVARTYGTRHGSHHDAWIAARIDAQAMNVRAREAAASGGTRTEIQRMHSPLASFHFASISRALSLIAFLPRRVRVESHASQGFRIRISRGRRISPVRGPSIFTACKHWTETGIRRGPSIARYRQCWPDSELERGTMASADRITTMTSNADNFRCVHGAPLRRCHNFAELSAPRQAEVRSGPSVRTQSRWVVMFGISLAPLTTSTHALGVDRSYWVHRTHWSARLTYGDRAVLHHGEAEAPFPAWPGAPPAR